MPRPCRRTGACCCSATICATSPSRLSGSAASAHSAPLACSCPMTMRHCYCRSRKRNNRFSRLSRGPNHGQRVVVGQRMLQAATNVFLGWTESAVDGRYFYVRRLKDQRLADIGARLAAALPFYAGLCGRTLARAHARSGDAVSLSGYIGDITEFDKAIAEFARAYADQTERDWRALLDAIAVGRIPVEPHPAGQPP